MPQLDVGTYASQIFWLIVAFATLYYLLSTKALPRVSDTLEARQDRIAADLDQAQSLRREAEETLATYERLIAEAQDEARAVLSEQQARLEAEAANRQQELDQQLARQLADAERRIAAARQSAVREIEAEAAAVAQAAAERLAGVKVADDAARSALEGVVRESAR